jgi:hypothetical protein
MFAQKRITGTEFRTNGPSDLKVALCSFQIPVQEATFINPTYKNGWMLVFKNKPTKEIQARIEAWNNNPDTAYYVMLRDAPISLPDASVWERETFVFKLSTIAAPNELDLNSVMDELASRDIMPSAYPVLALVHLKDQPGLLLLTILGRANARALCETESFVVSTVNNTETIMSVETALSTATAVFSGCCMIVSTGWSRGSTSAQSVKHALKQLTDQLGEEYAPLASPEHVHIVSRDHSPTGQVLIFYKPTVATDILFGSTIDCGGSLVKFEKSVKEEKASTKPPPSSPKKSTAQDQLAPRLAKKPAAKPQSRSWAQRTQITPAVKQEVIIRDSKMEEESTSSLSSRVTKIEETMNRLTTASAANGSELRTIQANLRDVLQHLQKGDLKNDQKNDVSKRPKTDEDPSA